MSKIPGDVWGIFGYSTESYTIVLASFGQDSTLFAGFCGPMGYGKGLVGGGDAWGRSRGKADKERVVFTP